LNALIIKIILTHKDNIVKGYYARVVKFTARTQVLKFKGLNHFLV
jgi:hypothetical protein